MISKKIKTILAGDIGGTKTRLGLFTVAKERFHLLFEKTFLSENYRGLEKILREFLSEQKEIDVACFGVAAPVTGRIIRLTNLPWVIDTPSLQKELPIRKVEIINDLVANAYGISVLKKSDFEVINIGQIRKGNAALLSAGTGLGEAILFWNGKQHLPSPSEGGHADFAPRNHLEIELLQYLLDRFGHVSYERVLSGTGLFYIYQFLKDSKKFGHEPKWLSKEMKQRNPAAVISEMARQKKNRLCTMTLDIFTSIYGAAAGSLALHALALGGVYIGGGIAPKIIWKLKDGTFMKAFKDKGRYSDFLSQIPVKVIMNERTVLLGAAFRAKNLLRDS